jgi:hypothetical protein
MTRDLTWEVGDRRQVGRPCEIHDPRLPVPGPSSVTTITERDWANRAVVVLVSGRNWIRDAGGHVAVAPHEVVIVYTRPRGERWRVDTVTVRGPACSERGGQRLPPHSIEWAGPAAVAHPDTPGWLAKLVDDHQPDRQQGEFSPP